MTELHSASQTAAHEPTIGLLHTEQRTFNSPSRWREQVNIFANLTALGKPALHLHSGYVGSPLRMDSGRSKIASFVVDTPPTLSQTPSASVGVATLLTTSKWLRPVFTT